MREDKKLAINLRLGGKSYNQIQQALGIPKSTLATWFKDNLLSQKVKKILVEQARKNSSQRIKKLAQANKIKWEKWREEARKEAKKEFASLVDNPLFVAGLMLYWGEGDSKAKNPLKLTNTNPQMIALYVKFLTQVLNVPKEKLRVALILYPDLSEEKSVRFWSKITSITRAQFYKPQFIAGRHPTKRLSNGICMITFRSGQLKERIGVWIDLMSQKLLQ